MEHFGAQIPEDESKVVEEESDIPPLHSDPEEKVEVEEPEEKIEDNALLTPDNDAPLEIGDSSIEVTEEMMDNANNLKVEAMQAQREGNLAKAVELYTQAIKTNSRSGILYGSRAQALLELKKPVAAIKDCDIAINKNPDSAKAYKVRGRAHRSLGNYEQALKDIQMGQKLDWDESSNKFEHEVKEFVDKIVAQRKKREQKEKKKSRPAPQPTPQPTPQESHNAGMPNFGEMPNFGGMPNMPGVPPNFMQDILNDPEVLTMLQDPKVQEALSDPAKMAELQNDPRMAKLFAKFGGQM